MTESVQEISIASTFPEPLVFRTVSERRSVSARDDIEILGRVSTWILCFVLLVFASQYGFSFEHGSRNTSTGAQEIQGGVSTGDAGESLVVTIQGVVAYLLSVLVMTPFIYIIGGEFRRNIPVLALLVWMALSVFWSSSPRLSGINGARMFLCVALAVYLVKRYTTNDLMKLLLLVGSVSAAASVALIFAFPQYGLQNRSLSYAVGAWQGIFGHKNICGFVTTLLLLPAFFVRLTGHYARIFRVAYIAAGLVIIAMTQSAGAWVVCGMCLTFIAAITCLRRVGRKEGAVVALGLLGIVAVAILMVYANFDSLMFLLGKDPTMTHRTVIWATLIDSALKRPILGYGFWAFWQGLNGESANVSIQFRWPGMAYAENGLLELWLELGAVGVALYLAAYLRAVKDAIYCFRRDPSPAVMWYIAVLFYVAATNIEAGYLLLPSDLRCIVPFVAFIGLRMEAKRLSPKGIHGHLTP